MANRTWTASIDTTQFEADAARIVSRVVELEAELDNLKDAQLRNAISSRDFADAHARITAELQAERAAMQATSGALSGQSSSWGNASKATQYLAKGLKGAGDAAGGGGQGLLKFARLADDAKQFSNGLVPGLTAIGNNLVESTPSSGSRPSASACSPAGSTTSRRRHRGLSSATSSTIGSTTSMS
jgi:hypothetical protein